jgi:hypothetical protein
MIVTYIFRGGGTSGVPVAMIEKLESRDQRIVQSGKMGGHLRQR